MYPKSRKVEAGQGMVEYIIIVALIALAGIAAFSLFGESVRGQTAQMAKQVAGVNDSTGKAVSTAAAAAAVTKADTNVTLGNYDAQDTP